MRANDPVGDCLRIIENLQSQLAYSQTQLQPIFQHLAFFKPPLPPPPFSSFHPSLLPLQFSRTDPFQFQDF